MCNRDRKKSQFLAPELFLYGLTISGFFILKRLDSLKYTLNFLTACFKRGFCGIMHDEALTKTSAWEAISKNTYVRQHCLQTSFLLFSLLTSGEVSEQVYEYRQRYSRWSHLLILMCQPEAHWFWKKKKDSFVSRVTNLNNKTSNYKFPTLNSSATDQSPSKTLTSGFSHSLPCCPKQNSSHSKYFREAHIPTQYACTTALVIDVVISNNIRWMFIKSNGCMSIITITCDPV